MNTNISSAVSQCAGQLSSMIPYHFDTVYKDDCVPDLYVQFVAVNKAVNVEIKTYFN